MVLDQRRIRENRWDVLCCIKKAEATKPRPDLIRTWFNKYFVPFVFRPSTKGLTILITLCLVTLGAFSSQKLLRGLNQNVSLVSGSALYDYFETLFTYGDAGPPAYVIFNNVNYTDPENLEQIGLLNQQLSTLNKTVLNPIYSWVTPYH